MSRTAKGDDRRPTRSSLTSPKLHLATFKIKGFIKGWVLGKLTGCERDLAINRDFTNQNATQFGNTETEKGLGRECCHKRGKNNVTDANATSLEAELYKSFKLVL